MRGFHSIMILCVVACGGAEFTSADSAAGGTGGANGTGVGGASGSGGARDAGAKDAPGSFDVSPDARDGGAAGAPRNSGDCDTKEDCGGDPCVELAPGSYRVCLSPVTEATSCSIPSGECCSTADCSSGRGPSRCILGPAQPACGGPAVVPSNTCANDACRTASDCSGSNPICVPAGALYGKAARCMTGGCTFDRDCAGSSAICAPVVESCCSAVVGLFCVFPNGCRRDADCMVGQHCAIQGNHTTCASGAVACPASL
jgi:hypothetical protein